MTGTQFTNLIRDHYTKTDSTTLTDAELLVLANVEQAALAEEIAANVDEGYFLMTDTRNLEAGVRNYTYPLDWLKSARYVSAKLDGTNPVYLRELDFGYIEGRSLPLLDNTQIKNEFSTKEPHYLFKGTELYILSGDDIEAVTDGLELVAEVYPEDLVTGDLSSSDDLSIPSSTTTVRLPRAAYNVLAKRVSIAWKSSKDKPLPLTESEKLLAVDQDKLYEKLRGRNAVRVITGKVPYNDGQDY